MGKAKGAILNIASCAIQRSSLKRSTAPERVPCEIRVHSLRGVWVIHRLAKIPCLSVRNFVSVAVECRDVLFEDIRIRKNPHRLLGLFGRLRSASPQLREKSVDSHSPPRAVCIGRSLAWKPARLPSDEFFRRNQLVEIRRILPFVGICLQTGTWFLHTTSMILVQNRTLYERDIRNEVRIGSPPHTTAASETVSKCLIFISATPLIQRTGDSERPFLFTCNGGVSLGDCLRILVYMG